MTSYLITGSLGQLGEKVIANALSDGDVVVASDLQPIDEHWTPFKADQNYRYIGDIFSEEKFRQNAGSAIASIAGSAVFIHLAGIADAAVCESSPLEAFASNVSLVFQALEICRRSGIRRFVFPSSGYVYGDRCEGAISEKASLAPVGTYALTKVYAEQIVKWYCQHYDMKGIVVRISNVYGSGNKATVINEIVSAAMKDREISVRDVTPIRDFIHIEDAARGIIKLSSIETGEATETVNLSTGAGHSIGDVIRLVLSLAPKARCRADLLEIQVPKNNSALVLDNRKLFQTTGWSPRISLKDGLKLMLCRARKK